MATRQKINKTNAQQGIGKMGAEVLNLSIRTSINISDKLNICTSNSPTSPSPQTVGGNA